MAGNRQLTTAPKRGGARRPPTIYLHIGTNKTGTTALQDFFAAHRDTLAKHGLLYPRAAVHANAHHPIAWQCGFHQGPPPPSELDAEALASQIKDEIAQHPGAAVLLSSEFLCLPGNIRALKQLLKPAKFRVVVYLRRHDHWLQSVYVQAVKTVMSPRWGRGIDAYFKYIQGDASPLGKYRAIVDGWAGFVEPENVIVRPFEREQLEGGLHRDLLRAIGLPEAAAALPDLPRSNESLSFEGVALIDIVTHTRLPEPAKLWVRDSVQRADPGHQKTAPLLSPASRLARINAHAADYEHIARTYLGREDGRLFLEPLPDPDASWTAPAHPTMMWLTERLAAILAVADPKVVSSLREAAPGLMSGEPIR